MDKKTEIIQHPLFSIIGGCGDKLNIQLFVIGGWVRDSLLKRVKKEIEFDIVSSGCGITLAKEVAKKLKIKKISIYRTFGTAAITYNSIKIEFNGARKESYHLSSRNPTIQSGTLKEDQERRDFTINAMAISLNKETYGNFIDPFNGIKDLNEKIIRTPLDPNQTYIDDPLRMLRAIRFATTLNFKIEINSLNAIKNNSERLNIIKQERITEELNQIILSDIPSRGFNLLSENSLLKLFFEEFELLRGVENRNGITHKDNFYHTLQVLDNISKQTDSLWLRWAAILHDIAKPKTKRFDKKNGWTFHGHEHLGCKMIPNIFKKLKLPLNENMKYVQKLVLLHLRPIALAKENVTDSAVRRLLFDAQNTIDDLMTLCFADITSKNKNKVHRYTKNLQIVYQKIKNVEERDKIRNWRPPIDGDFIMKKLKLKPSKLIGVIKLKIRESILEGEIKNNSKEAVELMYEIAKELNIKY